MTDLTEKKAIRECKRLWEEIEKSGLSKDYFLASPNGEKWVEKNYLANCPLCEYSGLEDEDCVKCPLIIQFEERCVRLGFDENKCNPRFFEAVRGLKE